MTGISNSFESVFPSHVCGLNLERLVGVSSPRYTGLSTRAVRLIEIEIKSRFEIARFLNRFIARLIFIFFIFLRPAPTSRSMLSTPIRMQQNRTDRAYRQIVC